MLTKEKLTTLADGEIWTGDGEAPKGAIIIDSLVRRDAAGKYVTHWGRLAPARRTLSDETRAATAIHIATHMSDHDQINMLTAATGLSRLYAGQSLEDLPESARVATIALVTVESWVRAVRVANWDILAALDEARSFEELIAVDATLPPAPVDQINIAKAATLG